MNELDVFIRTSNEERRIRGQIVRMNEMFCRDATTLHNFAHWIGADRRYFLNSPPYPHYVITPHLAKIAIDRGAVRVSAAEMYVIVRSHRNILNLRV